MSVGFSNSPSGPFDLNAAIASVPPLLSAERLDEAQKTCELILSKQPGFPPANFFLAVVAAKRGDMNLATDRLRDVVKADPNAFEAVEWLANMLRDRGQLEEAAQLATQMIRLRPAQPNGPSLLGMCYLDQGQPLKALEYNQRAATLAPSNPGFRFNLARTFDHLNRVDQAVTEYRQAMNLAPGAPMIYDACAKMLLKNGRRVEGIWCLEKLVELAPSRDGLLELGSALIDDGKHHEAVQVLRRVIDFEPDVARAYELSGSALQVLGRFEEAEANLKRAIELDPTTAGPYLLLANAMRMTEKDQPFVDKLAAMADEGNRNESDVRKLNYALGKAASELGDFEEAMRRYDMANGYGASVPIQRTGFNRREYSQWISGLITTFSKKFFADHQGLGLDSEVPVFIVGMPRSGTTLTDQILTSHPKIGAVGELLYWGEPPRADLTMNLALGRLKRQELQETAAQYLGFLEQLAPGLPRVTDKMPLNYLSLGLIHLVLPKARIIHCRRNAIDTCLSIYMTPDVGEFGMDRRGMVDLYREYLRIMQHWRQVLPPDRFIEIDYENVVENTEAVARQLVEFSGLQWDDACLRHTQNKHSVRTPSKWQVRQPIYRTSLEKWRQYEPWLREFNELA